MGICRKNTCISCNWVCEKHFGPFGDIDSLKLLCICIWLHTKEYIESTSFVQAATETVILSLISSLDIFRLQIKILFENCCWKLTQTLTQVLCILVLCIITRSKGCIGHITAPMITVKPTVLVLPCMMYVCFLPLMAL